MKTPILLNIHKPCSENWEAFTPASNGGFCSTCAKTVVDFTKMTDDEIMHYFAHQTNKTCGRFRVDQLKQYEYREPMHIRPGLRLLKAGLLGLFVFLANRPGIASPTVPKPGFEVVQTVDQHERNTAVDSDFEIKGVVKVKEDGTTLAGVNIYVKGSTEPGTISDADGNFVFPRRLQEGEVLIFSFIGFDSMEYVVKKDANETIELTMGMEYCVMLGEVAVDQVYKPKHSGIRRAWEKVKGLF